MAIKTASLGAGTILEYSTNLTTPSYTALGNIVSYTPAKTTSAEIPTTVISATAKTKLLGTPDYGDDVFEIIYHPDNTALIRGWQTNKTAILIRVTFNDVDGSSTKSTNVKTVGVKEFEISPKLTDDALMVSTITFCNLAGDTYTQASA